MLIFMLFFISNFPNSFFGLHCVHSEEPIIWPLNDFVYDAFEKELDSFPVYDYDDYRDMCTVEIYIDYQAYITIISFGDSFEATKLEDGEGRLDFLIMFNESNAETEYYNVLEYACYDEDVCDKSFVLKHIYWLQRFNITLLEANLKSILFYDSTYPENCYTDKVKSSKCSTGVCSTKYSTYHKNYLFECHQNSRALVEVHITTVMIVFHEVDLNQISIEDHHYIRYTCKFDQCNSQQLTDKLINTVTQYFQLSEMKEAFLLGYNQRINDTSLSPVSNQTSTLKSTTTRYYPYNDAHKQSYPSFTFIFMVLFVFIKYPNI